MILSMEQYESGHRRWFVAYFHFTGWDQISLGCHICLSLPNIEIHVPFGFIRVGWSGVLRAPDGFKRRSFGYEQRFQKRQEKIA